MRGRGEARSLLPGGWGGLGNRGWRGSVPGETGDERRLLPSGVVQSESTADLLEAISRKVLENLPNPRLPGASQGLNQGAFTPAIRDRELEAVHSRQQLVPLQPLQHISLAQHRCLSSHQAKPPQGVAAEGGRPDQGGSESIPEDTPSCKDREQCLAPLDHRVGKGGEDPQWWLSREEPAGCLPIAWPSATRSRPSIAPS